MCNLRAFLSYPFVHLKGLRRIFTELFVSMVYKSRIDMAGSGTTIACYRRMHRQNENPEISLRVNIIDFDRVNNRTDFLEIMETHVSSCAECLRAVLVSEEALEDAGCLSCKRALKRYDSLIRENMFNF